jgi:PAS domain-containing protein
VYSDLRQFYDRVHPALLNAKIEKLKKADDDPRFFDFTKRLLSWTWHVEDANEVAGYASAEELEDFSKVALPQGLVAAGFFANISLLDFDQELRKSITQEIKTGIRVVDVCRYVDDLRIVLTVDQAIRFSDLKEDIVGWLQELLDIHARGLKVSSEKTKAAAFGGDEPPILMQSKKTRRIQGAITYYEGFIQDITERKQGKTN